MGGREVGRVRVTGGWRLRRPEVAEAVGGGEVEVGLVRVAAGRLSRGCGGLRGWGGRRLRMTYANVEALYTLYFSNLILCFSTYFLRFVMVSLL